MLALLEMDELVKESIQAYAGALNAIHAERAFYPGILTVSEENLNHNGGIIIFPAKRNLVRQEANMQFLFGKQWLLAIHQKTKTFLHNKPHSISQYWGEWRDRAGLEQTD